MPSPRTLTTTTTVELEVTLEGEYVPGYPSSLNDPGTGEDVENVRVTKIITAVPYWSHSDGNSVVKYQIVDLTHLFRSFPNISPEAFLVAIPDAETLLLQEVEE